MKYLSLHANHRMKRHVGRVYTTLLAKATKNMSNSVSNHIVAVSWSPIRNAVDPLTASIDTQVQLDIYARMP